MAIYWTKRKMNEDNLLPSNELEEIKEETEMDFVPDGDGFEINMNGISYEEYKEDPDKFIIIKGTLERK